MSKHLISQPNGQYCVFNTDTEDFAAIDVPPDVAEPSKIENGGFFENGMTLREALKRRGERDCGCNRPMMFWLAKMREELCN